jgi:hypothetical protein
MWDKWKDMGKWENLEVWEWFGILTIFFHLMRDHKM